MATSRLILIGAGFTGRVVTSEYVRSGRRDLLVGLLDDDVRLHGQNIEGVPVLGGVGALEAVVGRHPGSEVLIAIPSLAGVRLRAIVDACRAVDVPVRTMPSILELLGEPLSGRLARPVHVADLLRRAQVNCQQPAERYLREATVLITGGGGSIGSELARQVVRGVPRRLVLVGHGENSLHDVTSQLRLAHPEVDVLPAVADVRDRVAMQRLLRSERPDVVFHAAAHKHVPMMEAQPDEAVRNNVLGTRVVTDAAIEADVPRLVFISTDKAVQPAGVMGATKRIGEWIVADAGRKHGRAFATVRFGNVLGSRGSLVPVLERQLARGGPLTITDPAMTRFFLTVPEAVYLVLQAGGQAAPGNLFVLDMGEAIPILELARDLVRLSGRDPEDVPVVFTGLRPGEKLEERLWEPDSIVEAVGHGVLRVTEAGPALSGEALDRAVEALDRAAAAGRSDAVRELLASLTTSAVSG